MAQKLFVRGASANVAISDLGVTIAQGPGWTQLNYSSPGDAEGDAGQFTARELRDSGDLFDLVVAGTLEWSKDESVVEAAGDYVADYMLTEDFTDDFFDLSDGGLVFPHDTTLPASGVEGQTFWDDDDNNLYVWDGTSWQLVGDQSETNEPTGFENRTDSEYSFVNGTRTFTIQPTGSNYSIFFSGRRVVKDSAESVVISDTEGIHYIYFDDADDTLKSTTTFNPDFITTDVFTAIVYWNADDNQTELIGDERHGIVMDGVTHLYLHNTQGAQWGTGLALDNINPNQDGSADSHVRFSVTDGTFFDEDIKLTITDDNPTQDLDPVANIPVFWKESAAADWRVKPADTYPIIQAGSIPEATGSRPSYNEWTGSTWQLTEVPNGNFFLMHYFAGNDLDQPIIAIAGENAYTSLSKAIAGVIPEFNGLFTTGLPGPEFAALGTVIFEVDNSFTNTPKAIIVTDDINDPYTDWRNVLIDRTGTPAGALNDHGSLGGLDDDDHAHYFLLDGDKIRNVVADGDGVTWNGDFDATSGIITLPQATDIDATFPSAGEGDIAWDTDDNQVKFFDGDNWIGINEMASGVIDHLNLLNIGTNSHTAIDNHIADGSLHLPADHGDLTGLGDDDHTQYLNLDGDLVRNVVTGGVDFSTASGLIVPNGTSTTGQTETEGNIFWDSDDDVMYVYDGSDWVSLGSTIASGIIDHGDLLGLTDDDHLHYLTEARHDALASDNPHSVTFTQAVTADGATDISAAEAETLTDGSNADSLHIHASSGYDHGELQGLGDDDHEQYTEWAGEETVTGVWTFDPVDSEPNFILDPRPSAPTYNNVDGAIAVIDDLLYAYDDTRGKWLSVDRTTFTGGRNGNANNIYLRLTDNLASSATGVRMLRNGTITGLFAQTEGVESWTFEVRNAAGGVLTSLVIGAADGGQDSTINVDVSAGDEIRLYVNGSGIMRPYAGFEIAWRA